MVDKLIPSSQDFFFSLLGQRLHFLTLGKFSGSFRVPKNFLNSQNLSNASFRFMEASLPNLGLKGLF